MPTYKLSYFDMDGGRAEPIRIAFHAAGIPFEDERVGFPDFGKFRETTPFNTVPVLEIDGVPVTQSNAMCQYAGKLAGMYPVDALQALYCDEVLGAVEDMSHHMVRTFGLEGEALKSARKELAEGWFTVYTTGLGKLLERGGGKYFADNKLTVADLKVHVMLRMIIAGNLDHIPEDFVEKLAPNLAEHSKRIANEPQVLAYYAR
jgi:glutathione S-transferase